MPGLLPIIVASAHLALATDQVPQLDVQPSCHAATLASVAANRNESVCMRDEQAARGKLQQDWAQYTPPQKSHCVQLSTLGGSPSYVELLTCLELDKAANDLPNTAGASGGRIER